MRTRLGSQTLRLCVTALLALTFGVFSFAATGSAQTLNQLDLGIAVPGGDAEPLAAAETEIGRSVDFVRLFSTWDDAFPTDRDLNALDGRNILLSVRPIADDGTRILWADIAAAQPGDPLHNDMVRWAQSIKPYQDQIWFTFNHEPEALSNIAHGDAAEFIDAWRAFMTVLDDEGVETLGRTWVSTSFAFQVLDDDRRAANTWYPGDEWVDVIAADAYNWHECRDEVTSPWIDLADLIEGFRRFGLEHPDQGLLLAEFGTVEDVEDPNRKAQWFADARATLNQPAYSQFIGASYFSVDDIRPGITCEWSFDSSPVSAAGFAALADDAAFGGTAAPLPIDPTDTPVPCQATITDAGVLLEWNLTGRNNILRNNAWIANPGDATSFLDANAPADATYTLRNRPIAGGVFDHDCIVPEEPAPEPEPTPEPEPEPTPEPEPAPVPAAPCQVTVTADGAVIDWTVEDNRYICLLYTSPSPRDQRGSRMPSSA